MKKGPSSGFQQCFWPFTMFLVEVSSETGFFRHLYNHLFRSPEFRKDILYQGHRFFWKCSKFNVDFKNPKKNQEWVFCFWDYSIWIGFVKLSLLRREYLSSAVNVLTNSLNILHSTNRQFFQLNFVHIYQQIW